MSIKVLSKVWEHYPGDSSVALLALLALADWSDDQGRSFPSIGAIALKCRTGRRQAQRNINSLIEDGLVSVIGNINGGKPGSTRRYKINLSRLTGVVNDTGVTNDAEGCHICPDTGVIDVTQYVIDTSIPVKKVSHGQKAEITLKQFLEECKAGGAEAIPMSDPVFEYAETVGLDDEMIAICWEEFKAAYLPGDKNYADWRAAFRNAVRKNYYKLWFVREGDQAAWTSVGEQARRAAR